LAEEEFMVSRSVFRRALVLIASVGLVGVLFGATIAPVAAASAPGQVQCGGTFEDPAVLGSGTYGSVVVTGFCFVPPGSTIVIGSGLTVAPGGFLVASAAFDGVCDRSITIGGGVRTGLDSSLFLGDGAGSGCVPNTHTVVNGGIRADRPFSLVIHGVVVHGGVQLVGGGAPVCDEVTFNPCSFSAVEDSQVSGGISVSGYSGFWFGMARNQVSGVVSLQGNSLADPDAMEILSNSIKGSLVCAGNSPVTTNIADGLYLEPNSVSGAETGQCAGL
jgi:hypothetical protein